MDNLQIKKEGIKVSQAIGTNAVKVLGKNLELTQEQLQKANAVALLLSQDAKLKNCDAYSLINYCYTTARFNFTRDDAIYPVPYGNQVQAQLSYKGLKELAERSGNYKKVWATLVYENDKLYRDRETGEIKVQFNEDINSISGKVIGFYAYAINQNNEMNDTFYMSVEQVKNHAKTYSKTYMDKYGNESGVWKYNFNAMGLKTVLKQLCSKQLNQSNMMKQAVKLDQLVFSNKLGKGAYLDNPHNNNEEEISTFVPKEETKIDEETGEILEDNAIDR